MTKTKPPYGVDPETWRLQQRLQEAEELIDKLQFLYQQVGYGDEFKFAFEAMRAANEEIWEAR